MHDITRKPNKKPSELKLQCAQSLYIEIQNLLRKAHETLALFHFPKPPTPHYQAHRNTPSQFSRTHLQHPSKILHKPVPASQSANKSAKRQILTNCNKKTDIKIIRAAFTHLRIQAPSANFPPNPATESLTNEVPESVANTSEIQLLRNLRESVRKGMRGPLNESVK